MQRLFRPDFHGDGFFSRALNLTNFGVFLLVMKIKEYRNVSVMKIKSSNV